MPMMLVAPLMSALAVTLRVAGSIVTIDLPSTSPMIEPASAETAKQDAASRPRRAVFVTLRDMESLPVNRLLRCREASPPAVTGRVTGAGRLGFGAPVRNTSTEFHVSVRRRAGRRQAPRRQPP